MNRLMTALAAVLLAGALVACTGGGDATPTAEGTTAASPAASPAARATETATEEASPSPTGDDDDDDGTNDDDSGDGDQPNELAEVLPEEVGGMQLTYQYGDADDLADEGGEISPEAEDFLERLGADSDDVSSAFGVGADQENATFVTIVAFRVAGADEGELRDEFQRTVEEQSETGQTATEGTLAGKDVLIFEGDDPMGTTYMYAREDIVFLVGATSQELAEQVLSELP